MDLRKGFWSLLLCIIMACCFVLFASCEQGNKEGDLPTEGEQNGDSAGTELDLEDVIAAIGAQYSAGVSLEATVGPNGESSADDRSVYYGRYVATVDAASQDLDLMFAASEAVPPYQYFFARSGRSFSTAADEPIETFSQLNLQYGGEIWGGNLASGSGMVGLTGNSQMSWEWLKLAAGRLLQPGSALVPLLVYASRSEALETEGNLVTVDLNSLLADIYSDLSEVIAGLNDNTKIIDIVQTDFFCNLIEAATFGAEPQQVYSVLSGLLPFLSETTVSLPAPSEEDETIYDYLVGLLSSQAFSNFISGAAGVSIPVAIGDLNVAQLIYQSTGSTLAEGKFWLAQNMQSMFAVTDRSFAWHDDSGQSFVLEDAKAELSLASDYKVQSVSLSFCAEQNGGGSEFSGEISLCVNYSDEKPILTDISSCKIEMSRFVAEDGVYSLELKEYIQDSEDGSQYSLPVISIETEDNFVTRIWAEKATYDAETGERLASEALQDDYDSVQQTLTVFWENEQIVYKLRETLPCDLSENGSAFQIGEEIAEGTYFIKSIIIAGTREIVETTVAEILAP